MKALNFKDDIPSIPTDNIKDNYILLFDLISLRDAFQTFHFTELFGETPRLELGFTFPLEHVT